MENKDLTKVSELAKLKESINSVIDGKIENAQIAELTEGIKNCPFLTCKRLFEGRIGELYELKEGKRLIKDYVRLMRENKSMRTSYLTYDNILNGDHVSNPDIFVNACVSLKEGINGIQLANGLGELRKITAKAIRLTNPKLDVLKEGMEKDKMLCEALDNVFIREHTARNSTEYANSLSVIMENVRERLASKAMEGENEHMGSTVKENMDKINGLLSEGDLEEWQRNLIADTITYGIAGNNERLFEEYKGRCIGMLSEAVEDEDESEVNRNKMKLMMEQLGSKGYNKDTFLEDMVKLGSLMETIKNN